MLAACKLPIYLYVGEILPFRSNRAAPLFLQIATIFYPNKNLSCCSVAPQQDFSIILRISLSTIGLLICRAIKPVIVQYLYLFRLTDGSVCSHPPALPRNLFITASRPPNIQRFPKAIQAQESAFTSGKLPNALGSMAISIPMGMENSRHHLGQGVRPLAKAFICVISKTAKNIQNSKNAGNTK